LISLQAWNDTEQLIRQDERDQIARELHDSTSQLLVVLGLQLMRLRQLSFAPASSVVNEVMSELSTTLDELHDGVRSVGGRDRFNAAALAGMLKAMAEKFASRTSLRIDAQISDLPDNIPPKIAETLYRVAQEALANAFRHARASKVLLRLKATHRFVTLRVADNGVGFPKSPVMDFGGCGLANMKSRLEEIGGSLTIHNRKKGALIEAKIRLDVLAA
jgi:two-component system NarL family sensor kinase/two-component system sensor histidine kinase UhpB